MGRPAAKLGDTIFAIDTHLVFTPPIPNAVPLPHPFKGTINGNLSTNVKIMGKPAATVGSIAINMPPHIPTPPGIAFLKIPSNKGIVQMGSLTVRINGKMAARAGDTALTCNDPIDLPIGRVIATGTVLIGG
ncbi:PAAR domain-containing protein [Floridanema aerugineum]|uniref:PAAR domain-containing protein n=1 Tax=Floridaenema aerugineum BLCC-F46 TaxID=3153654 RepID=A0ABV4WXZ1_9CYAN